MQTWSSLRWLDVCVSVQMLAPFIPKQRPDGKLPKPDTTSVWNLTSSQLLSMIDCLEAFHSTRIRAMEVWTAVCRSCIDILVARTAVSNENCVLEALVMLRAC